LSSDDRTDPQQPHDVGLLSPVSVLVADAVSDAAVARRMVAAEIALLRAYVARGHAPASVAAVADALVATPPTIDLAALARAAVAGGNPVIPLVALLRREVTAIDADAAVWVHRGATSQDVLDTALMLLCRDVARAIDHELARAIAATAALAARHRDDPAAARTLTQHAVPTTLGLKAALWTRGLQRARAELARVAGTLPAQLGGAGGTLAAIVDRLGEDAALELPRAYAHELGLAAPASVWHTDRWPVTSTGAALAGVVAAAGVLASDVAQLARTEVGEAGPARGGGSSTMPQKANPVDAVLVRSAAMRAPALVSTLHLAAGLAVDERPDGAWHAEWPTLQELLRLALGAAERTAALAEGLTLHPERARANLDATGGAILGERLAIHLVPLIGRERFEALMADAADGAVRARVATLPEVAGLDLDALFDPSAYLGVAGRMTDDIVRAARDGGSS
jgi:3-carboxy-cis,cis-muconate cycloisomerase